MTTYLRYYYFSILSLICRRRWYTERASFNQGVNITRGMDGALRCGHLCVPRRRGGRRPGARAARGIVPPRTRHCRS